MRITVFTPTYNRGYVIKNLYESLKRQSFSDFEWIVVDDGSDDNTEIIFSQIMAENRIPVNYIKVVNGGKHRAINIGVQAAKGDLFFIVDSDDYLTDNALEKVIEIEQTIPANQRNKFAGICGLRGYSEKDAIGKTFEGDILDITTLERVQHGISGDKAEVFYTEILKNYPFPEFDGENFLTECVVWDRIAFAGFQLRFFNKIIYICEYLPDGLTAHSKELFLNNPKGYGLYLAQCAQVGKLFGVEKWKSYNRYYNQYGKKLKFSEIAQNLHISRVELYTRIFGLKLFYKIYDR